MESFAFILASLSISIAQNNLAETSRLIGILNAKHNIDNSQNEKLSDIIDFISATDLYNLETDNESFMYLLDNYKPVARETQTAMWDIHSRIINQKFMRHRISEEEFNNFILKIYEDIDSPIREYRYSNLIRLALVNKNYPLIIKIKQQMEEMGG